MAASARFEFPTGPASFSAIPVSLVVPVIP
jgi:hypothetical protein